MQCAQTNVSRFQVAVERLRMQQDRVYQLAAQLEETQKQAEMLKYSKAEMKEQVKQMENSIQQATNEEIRLEM